MAKLSPILDGFKNAKGLLRREWRALRRRKSGLATGLDFDGEVLRIAQVRDAKEKRPVLHRVITLPLHAENRKDLNPEIFRTVREWRVADGRLIAFLPRESVTVKRLTLPTTDPAELRRVATFEACRFLPRAPEEILADVEPIHTRDDGRCDAWLYAVLQTQAGELIELLDKLGLEPDVVETSMTALARVIGDEAEEAIPYCFVGNQRVDVLIRHGSSIIFSRGFDRAKFSDAAQLHQEILRSIQYAQRTEGIDALGKIRLLSDAEIAGSLAKNGNNSFQIVETLPALNLDPNHCPEMLAPYAPVIGAALANGAGINLYPDRLIKRREQRHKLRSIGVTCLLGLFALALCVIDGDLYLRGAAQHLAQQTQTLRTLSSEAKDLRRLEQRNQAIAQHLGSQNDPINIYSELFRVVPEGVAINQMEMARGKLMLKGQGKKYSEIWSLIDALGKSELIDGAHVQFASSRQVKGSTVIDFSIECGIRTKAVKRNGST